MSKWMVCMALCTQHLPSPVHDSTTVERPWGRLYGVTSSQMEAINWDEEEPKTNGHDEAAFAQNRRVDLVYPTK